MLFFAVLCLSLSLSALSFGLMFWSLQRYRRRPPPPRTDKLLRPPGASLQRALSDAQYERTWIAKLLLTLPLLELCVHLWLSLALDLREVLWRWLLVLMVTALSMTYLLYRRRHIDHLIQHLSTSLESTQAIAQELDQWMRQGAVVFHGVPVDKHMIDHVVICGNGIFALETRARIVPQWGHGLTEANNTVIFEGSSLKFPDRTESRAIYLAERQAAWLAKWLSHRTGHALDVNSVLVLPGWIIRRQSRGTTWVVNGQELHGLFRPNPHAPAVLSPEMIARISQQVEQRCRGLRSSPHPSTTPSTAAAPPPARQPAAPIAVPIPAQSPTVTSGPARHPRAPRLSAATLRMSRSKSTFPPTVQEF